MEVSSTWRPRWMDCWCLTLREQQQQQMQRTLTKKGAKMNMGELKVSHSKMVGNPSPGLVPWSDH